MNSGHQIIYHNIFKSFKINGLQVQTIGYSYYSRTTSIFSNFKFVFFSNITIFLTLIRSKKNLPYVVTEFSNWMVFICSPVLFLFRKNVFFVINHNATYKGRFSYILKILLWLDFHFILFDGGKIVKMLSIPKKMNLHTPFFPIDNVRFQKYSPKINKSEINVVKVGLVGIFNNSKTNYDDLSQCLHQLTSNSNVQVLFGIRGMDTDLENFLSKFGIGYVYTSTSEDYSKFLSKIDIGVILALREKYLFRNSGTIMDMAASGINVVCPDYPVFRSQIEMPSQIGVCYNNIGDVSEAVNEVINNFDLFRKNLQFYNEYRDKKRGF